MRIDGEIRSCMEGLMEADPTLAGKSRMRYAWLAAAGQEVAGHTSGVFVVPQTDEQEVIVYVDSPIWATELGLQAEMLRLRLNLELARGEGDSGMEATVEQALRREKVKKLSFRVSRESYHARRTGAEDDYEVEERPDPVPLDPRESDEVQSMVGGVEDVALRDAIYGALRACRELEKGERGNRTDEMA